MGCTDSQPVVRPATTSSPRGATVPDLPATAIAPPRTAPSGSLSIIVDQHSNPGSSRGSPNASHQPLCAGDVAGEAGVMRRDNSMLRIPTHTRPRGSSVSLVMNEADHLKSPRTKSPPSKSFEAAAQKMSALDLLASSTSGAGAAGSGAGSGTASLGASLRDSGSMREGARSPNPLSVGRMAMKESTEDMDGSAGAPQIQTIAVTAAHDVDTSFGSQNRRDSLSSGDGTTPRRLSCAGSDHDQQFSDGENIVQPVALLVKKPSHDGIIDDDDAPSALQNKVAAASQLSASSSLIDIGSRSSSGLQQQQKAADVAGEIGVLPRGNSLVIPTSHEGRRRSSSVRLVLEPEQHLVSPRHKSPPRGFEEHRERAKLPTLDLGAGSVQLTDAE